MSCHPFTQHHGPYQFANSRAVGELHALHKFSLYFWVSFLVASLNFLSHVASDGSGVELAGIGYEDFIHVVRYGLKALEMKVDMEILMSWHVWRTSMPLLVLR